MNPLKCGILAAGRGERLCDRTELKPLVQIAGKPLIVHVLNGFAELGAVDVSIIINEVSTAVRDLVASREWPFAINWIVATTASSMHSFLRLMEAMADGGDAGPFLISTVDTIVPHEALLAFHSSAANSSDDVILAVNEPAEDDNPLWVQCDEMNGVTLLGDAAAGVAAQATAGIYAVRPGILAEANSAKASGLMSLRSFLALLLDRGYRFRAVAIGNSVDVDRAPDIIAAENLLQQTRT
jgi:NDP-sugar pyrophosphorylase family protein